MTMGQRANHGHFRCHPFGAPGMCVQGTEVPASGITRTPCAGLQPLPSAFLTASVTLGRVAGSRRNRLNALRGDEAQDVLDRV